MAAGVSATAIVTGRYHSCAMEKGGGVKCWGLNEDMQLGIGNGDSQLSPVDVLGARTRRGGRPAATRAFMRADSLRVRKYVAEWGG
jgi:hypothetical protein